eukprot:TRINITY_DN16792_c0_g1_i1.p1 TRINITY_DN16792_c0_g1~~TRINITY_DN16792_c0_g1_i1.p1  ORF type:complete len:475 (+),score=58.23 TRINITY_DN16792_c0_g1_i1:101-1525(+)
MSGADTCVVVGDGGLLHWSLGYQLRKAGWGKVVLVGEHTPRESASVAATFVPLCAPPRVENSMLYRNCLLHPYYSLHTKLRGKTEAPLPPYKSWLSYQALADAGFWNWALRLWPNTSESALLDSDVRRASLMYRQQELLAKMSSEHPELKDACSGPAAASDLYLDRASFADQRRVVASLESDRSAAVRQICLEKGRATHKKFPTLYMLADYVVGAVHYPEHRTTDMSVWEDRLRSVCTDKLGVQRMTGSVSRFERSGGQVTGVCVDGQPIDCGAVVLAAGADTPRLLREAGGPAMLPIYSATELVAEVKSTVRSDRHVLGELPAQSTAIQGALAFTRSGDSVRVSGLVNVDGQRRGWLSSFLEPAPAAPSFARLTSGQSFSAVTEQYADQMHKWAAIRVRPEKFTAAWVGEAALTPDSLPVIGRCSDDSNVYVCAGTGPSGGVVAVAAAERAAALTRGGAADPVFSLRRFWLAG